MAIGALSDLEVVKEKLGTRESDDAALVDSLSCWNVITLGHGRWRHLCLGWPEPSWLISKVYPWPTGGRTANQLADWIAKTQHLNTLSSEKL